MPIFKDLTGSRIGSFIVSKLERWDCVGKRRRPIWQMTCTACGTVVLAQAADVRSGRHSCTCSKKLASNRRIIDLSGAVCGHLVVIGMAKEQDHAECLWEAKCQRCETVFIKRSSRLRRMQGCPCKKDHGMVRSGTYSSWSNMIARCTQPSSPSYPRYGGRGIRVCERWRSFANFFADMGERPPGMRIERIDNDGNYEPGNCRWATHIEQQRNKVTNVRVTRNGVTKPIVAWAEDSGLSEDMLRYRISRARWSVNDAFDWPKGTHHAHKRRPSRDARGRFRSD